MKKALNLFILILALIPCATPRSTYAADDTFVVLPGDVLQISVWKEEGLDREVIVLPDGTVTFPLAGTIKVDGLTPVAVQDMVKDKLAKLIPDASVSVAVKAALGHSVNVIGQVAKPGEIVISHNLSAMQALSQAGGLTPYASESHIIILRREDGKETSIDFPYDDISDGDDLDKDITLNPGDVVVVPTASLF